MSQRHKTTSGGPATELSMYIPVWPTPNQKQGYGMVDLLGDPHACAYEATMRYQALC